MDKIQIIEQLFADYCDLTDAQRYFCDEEIQESKENFINDLLNNHKQQYISFIDEEIENIKPLKYGCYDLDLIRQYEDIKKRITEV